jgi:hypothetical protein
MENVTEVVKWFLLLNSGSFMKQMKTQILNLKKLKTQVLIGYLTIHRVFHFDKLIKIHKLEAKAILIGLYRT